MLSDMDLVSFAFLFGDLIVTEDEVHVFILFCERYYTLSSNEAIMPESRPAMSSLSTEGAV